jgi:hypothetical protein
MSAPKAPFQTPASVTSVRAGLTAAYSAVIIAFVVGAIKSSISLTKSAIVVAESTPVDKNMTHEAMQIQIRDNYVMWLDLIGNLAVVGLSVTGFVLALKKVPRGQHLTRIARNTQRFLNGSL